MINYLIKKWALWFPSFEITADKDSSQSSVSKGSVSLPLVTWIVDCSFLWVGCWTTLTSSFFSAKTASACSIILSVSFGIGLSFLFSLEETIFKMTSPFETLSPTLTSTFSIFPAIVEGISTLDLSLSIVITGSFNI